MPATRQTSLDDLRVPWGQIPTPGVNRLHLKQDPRSPTLRRHSRQHRQIEPPLDLPGTGLRACPRPSSLTAWHRSHNGNVLDGCRGTP